MLSLLLLVATVQEDVVAAATPAPDPRDERSVTAEGLREDIHDMRMNLLLGGDRVRRAETEAVEFYRSKVTSIDERVDTIHVDLAERRASYDLAIERTLTAGDASARREAMNEASRLRTDVAALEGESEQLGRKRTHLYKLIDAVEERDRERDRLVGQLETSGGFESGLDFALGTVGLAPAVQPPEPASPFEDDVLVQDLLRRDPRAARRILFEADPATYWARFPLRPPATALRQALVFPLPDLPGHR